MDHSFFIDKITNSVELARTGERFDTRVLPVVASDLKVILKKNGWRFNWRNEFKQADRQVFKLVIQNDTIIQGLVSLQRADNYIEMHLIEAAPHNYGKSKLYSGVPGNLVAFACKTSFELGFDGFVGFVAKTRLIQHYIDTLKAEPVFKNRMRISKESAEKLVNSYYKSFFHGR
jgi:hypothetical protein